jgi:hypothetical protein
MDPMNIMLGYSKDPDGGLWGIQTFTHAIESMAQSEGFMIGNCSAWGTWVVLSFFRMQTARENLPKFPIVKRGMGLFLKLSDEAHGQIFPNEKTSKPFTAVDEKKLKKGTDIMREIIIKSGGEVIPAGRWPWGRLSDGIFPRKSKIFISATAAPCLCRPALRLRFLSVPCRCF